MSLGPLRGLGAAPGRDAGTAWASVGGPARECQRLAQACQRTRAALEVQAARCAASGQTRGASMLRIHAMLLDDPVLLEGVRTATALGTCAEAALDAAATRLDRTHLPGRGAPAEEALAVLLQLRNALPQPPPRSRPGGRVVLVGAPPSLADVFKLHQTGQLAAVVAIDGGVDSHLGLIARELGVPAVMGTGLEAWGFVESAIHIVVDGDQGEVRPSGSADDMDQPPGPRFSTPVPGFAVRAALSSTAGLDASRAAGAEGVGLLRTDFLWGRSPAEVASTLREATQRAGEHGVTIRAYDQPSDVHSRGAGLLKTHAPEVTTLLEGAVRAQQAGPVRLLVPFIVHAEELASWSTALHAAARRTGHSPPPLGAMIETPASALAAASVLSRCDFGVVGTGDLSALLCGAGREVLGPAHRDAIRDVLRPLLARIAGAARSVNRPLEAAGPAARQPVVVCALRDLGYSGVSVAPADVAAVRDVLRA